MNLFTLLRQHAQNQPETSAASSRFRMMTYRKLWSRVERATARLQGEWGVKRGDTVAYRGQAHPDALVLYLALARCGARLVALEQPALQSEIDAIVRELDVKMILHDDHAPPERAQLTATIKPLSALIMTRCPYQPSDITEDPNCLSVIVIRLTTDSRAQFDFTSLDRMANHNAVMPDRSCQIADRLFDEHVFTAVVLPALASGTTLIFR
jgi:acyl-CoA synthetase (AMP-forming)/AMP-acid ligase II